MKEQKKEYLREAFAEYYSIYITMPETLEKLRPTVYTYFEKRF